MRTGVFAVGVLMMIIGGALVVFIPTGGQTPFIEIGGVGLILHQVVGAGLAVLGFLVFIVGLAASPPEKKTAAPVITYGPSHPSAPQPAPSAPKVLVVCPECGARISARSKFCPECGGKLGPKRKAKPRETEEEESEVPEPARGKPKEAGFCMYCGTEFPEGSDFCPECGRKVKS